jgi:hypothetical protein
MKAPVGARFKSAVCSTEVVVVKSVDNVEELWCGGVVMVPVGGEQPPDLQIVGGFATGTQVGKRYATEDELFEVLCTKAGAGSLSLGQVLLSTKGAKPLPPSD